jgi:putative endonuclease
MYVYVLSSRTRRDGTIRGSTHKYSIDRLVYYESFSDPTVAIRREKQIKTWSRVKKLALVESMNPAWIDYAEDWFPSARRADPSLRSG